MDIATPGSLLFLSGIKGWVGVEVFFVISGFVIPYSLARSGYRIRNFGRFLLKRIIRLDPPYIVSIVASISLATVYWWRAGGVYPYSLPQILLHLGYLNVFSKYEWISPIYWTLAVEVQYYVLVGLAFPLIMRKQLFWLAVAPLCVAAGFLLRNHYFVFEYLPLFILGIAALHYRRAMIGTPLFVSLCFVLALSTYFLIGRGPALAGFVTAMAIGKVNYTPRLLVMLGAISYSLYLIHVPAARLVAHALGPHITTAGQIGVAFLSLVASLTAAWLLHRVVELPSQRLSSRIRYKGE